MKRDLLKVLCFGICCASLVGGVGALKASATSTPESNVTLTIKMNGGFRYVYKTWENKEYDENDITYSCEVGSLTFTHELVQNIFKGENTCVEVYEKAEASLRGTTTASGIVIDENGYYISKNNGEYPAGVLFGLFEDTDGSGTYTPGSDVLYRSGDTIKINNDTTLYCYYENNHTYSFYGTNVQERTTKAVLKKALKGATPDEGKCYTAEELQPFFVELYEIGEQAFQYETYNNAIYGVELPNTVTKVGNSAFRNMAKCAYITGLDNVRYIGAEAFAGVGTSPNSSTGGSATLVLGPNLINVAHGAFNVSKNNGRIIFTGMDSAGIAAHVADFNANYGTSLSVSTPLGFNTNNWIMFKSNDKYDADDKYANPYLYVYVPYGQTSAWYPMYNGGTWTVNGQSVSGNTSNNESNSMLVSGDGSNVNVPMREMQTIQFDLNGGNIGGAFTIADTYMDAGAVSITKDGTEKNLTSYQTDTLTGVKTQLTSTNPAEQTLSLLKAVKPENPVKDGYAFAGWRDQNGYVWTDADWQTGGKLGYTEAKVQLTAVWAKERKVTYQNGESEYDSLIVAEGAKLTEPSNPTAVAHYTFGGWYTDLNDAESAWDFANDVVIADTVLYAKWNATEYQARLFVNGGVLETNETVVKKSENEYGMSFLYGSEQALPIPEREGYTFNGWFENEAFEAESVTAIIGGKYGAPCYYAKWTSNVPEAVKYNISYTLNGGLNSLENPDEYTEGIGVVLSNPTREGYTFGGWYLNADLTGEAITEITTAMTGDISLYAKWTGNESELPIIPGEPDEPEDPNDSGNDSVPSGDPEEPENPNEGCNGCGGTIVDGAIVGIGLLATVAFMLICQKKKE